MAFVLLGVWVLTPSHTLQIDLGSPSVSADEKKV